MSTAVIITCTDCGHATGPTSPAVAAYGYRAHSCNMTRERAARTQRRLDRLGLSGPEQPCQHNDRHPHGTRSRYVTDKCRCRRCRDAVSAYERARSRALAYGRTAYVPAGPARAHVQELQSQGMGWKRIARAADIHTSVMWKLLYGCPGRNMGPSKRVRAHTEQAILTVTLDLGATIGVPGIGTRRRLHALVAIGWSQSEVGRRLGMTPGNFGKVIHGTGNVNAATRTAVAGLYDELWDQAPPQGRWRNNSIRYAAHAGWAPPLAWDDDNIDDPHAQPDLGENNTPSWQKVHLDDIEWLIGDGSTLEQIAHRLHVGKSTIEQACGRAGRRDLLDRMLRNKTAQENAA